MEASPKIEVRGLGKSFGPVTVLKDVSLAVKAGEKAFVIGPSGSGKSTLLRCINCLVEPDAGEVLIDGRVFSNARSGNGKEARLKASETNRQRSRMPMVFQRFNLFQNRTALGNVMEAQIIVLKRTREAAEAKAIEVLGKVGLAHKAASYPPSLSGGEQQRVAIARALAMDPEIILFDEPTSSLDPELVGGVLDIMIELAAEGMTMMVVTHEMGFARQTADRIYFFCAGTITEHGPPQQIFDAPQRTETQGFIRAILRSDRQRR